jgi:hypothetical protein
VVSARPSSPIDCCQSANCTSRPRTSSSTAAAGPAPKARASAAASARTSSSRSSRASRHGAAAASKAARAPRSVQHRRASPLTCGDASEVRGIGVASHVACPRHVRAEPPAADSTRPRVMTPGASRCTSLDRPVQRPAAAGVTPSPRPAPRLRRAGQR